MPSAARSETSCQGTGYFDELPADAACWIEIAAADDTLILVRYTIPAVVRWGYRRLETGSYSKAPMAP